MLAFFGQLRHNITRLVSNAAQQRPDAGRADVPRGAHAEAAAAAAQSAVEGGARTTPLEAAPAMHSAEKDVETHAEGDAPSKEEASALADYEHEIENLGDYFGSSRSSATEPAQECGPSAAAPLEAMMM